MCLLDKVNLLKKCKLFFFLNTSPIIKILRTVPLSINDKFKHILVKLKVIEFVNKLVDWMSNIVIVEIPDKKLRIRHQQDFNNSLKIVKYLVPKLK